MNNRAMKSYLNLKTDGARNIPLVVSPGWITGRISLPLLNTTMALENYLYYNPIEGVHRQIRKITKTKGAFSSEQALMKLIYLVIQNISKKWTMPMHD
jgi:hypothetical protein